MEHMSSENEEVLRLFIIAAACIGAILTTIFSLTHGIFEVFPFLYILPIILAVYFYPRRAVLFTLCLSLMYLCLIFLLGSANTNLIAVSTAWFAIFMTLGVVASSYANNLQEERIRIRNVLKNSQDGIICFDITSQQILEINQKCAGWLRYERRELLGNTLAMIWTDTPERERFITSAKERRPDTETEGLFRAKDGTILRFIISSLMVTRNRALCSAIDITGNKIADEEIRRTLEDLEGQVKARTAHLERINEQLRAEILERRRAERQLLSGKIPPQDEEERK